MKIEQLIGILNSKLLPGIQDEYDNSGEQILFRGSDVRAIMISLDLDRDVLDEAVGKKCDTIITHHPLLFRPLRSINTGEPRSSLLVDIIDRRINVYSAHTNLDKLFHDLLASCIGLKNRKILYPEPGSEKGTVWGYGTLAEVEKPVPFIEFAKKVKSTLGIDFLVYTGDSDTIISRVAVLNGAGGRYIEKIIAGNPVDCIITGDVGYHQAKFARNSGVALIDAGHFGTERVFLGHLRDQIKLFLNDSIDAASIQIHVSENEKNPLKIYSYDNER